MIPPPDHCVSDEEWDFLLAELADHRQKTGDGDVERAVQQALVMSAMADSVAFCRTARGEE